MVRNNFDRQFGEPPKSLESPRSAGSKEARLGFLPVATLLIVLGAYFAREQFRPDATDMAVQQTLCNAFIYEAQLEPVDRDFDCVTEPDGSLTMHELRTYDEPQPGGIEKEVTQYEVTKVNGPAFMIEIAAEGDNIDDIRLSLKEIGRGDHLVPLVDGNVMIITLPDGSRRVMLEVAGNINAYVEVTEEQLAELLADASFQPNGRADRFTQDEAGDLHP